MGNDDLLATCFRLLVRSAVINYKVHEKAVKTEQKKATPHHHARFFQESRQEWKWCSPALSSLHTFIVGCIVVVVLLINFTLVVVNC